jgi:recombinational DNA repair protein (RecF pathway)
MNFYANENLEARLSYHSLNSLSASGKDKEKKSESKAESFDDLRRDYQDAVECLGYCESIINALQEKLARREELTI